MLAVPNVLSELCAIDRTRNENLLIPNHELSLMPKKHIRAEKEREREKKIHNCTKRKTTTETRNFIKMSNLYQCLPLTGLVLEAEKCPSGPRNI